MFVKTIKIKKKKKEAIEQFTKKKTYFFIVVRDCLAKECLELA